MQAARTCCARINSQPDETPGNVSYTTVRSLTDETVQPQGGKHPTSALDGASNILIQGVCPGSTTSHIGTAVDSVTFAAFVDAVAHRGQGEERGAPGYRASRPTSAHTPIAPGLNEAQTTLFLKAVRGNHRRAMQSMVPTVPGRASGEEGLQADAAPGPLAVTLARA